MSITLDEYIKKYNGKKIEYHSYSSNSLYQCTDNANQYIVECLGLPAIIGTNAQQFPDKAGSDFEYILNTPTGVPQKGDLIIWSSADNVGHIAIFIDGNVNKFNSFDQNYPTGTPCHIQAHTYLRPKVIGWLRAKVQSTQEFMQIEKEVFESLVTKSTAYDKFVEAGYQDAQSVTLSIETYTDRISTIKKDHDDFLREIVLLLDPETKVEIADQDLVKNIAKMRMSENSNLIEAKVKLERELEKRDIDLEEKIFDYEKQINGFKADLGEATLLIEKLKEKADFLTKENEKLKKQKTENKAFKSFINKLFSKIKGTR